MQSAFSADIPVCVLATFVGFLAKEVDDTALCQAFACTDAISEQFWHTLMSASLMTCAARASRKTVATPGVDKRPYHGQQWVTNVAHEAQGTLQIVNTETGHMEKTGKVMLLGNHHGDILWMF